LPPIEHIVDNRKQTADSNKENDEKIQRSQQGVESTKNYSSLVHSELKTAITQRKDNHSPKNIEEDAAEDLYVNVLPMQKLKLKAEPEEIYVNT
jgi:hypothetical protein